MPTKEQVAIQFLKQFLTKNYDLRIYRQPDFANHLQLFALNDMHFLLFKINHLLNKNTALSQQNLHKLINIPHPVTKLCLLDYCLIAGLHKIATKLVFSGAESKYLDSFAKKIDCLFANNQESLEVIENVKRTINEINLIKQGASSRTLLAPDASNLQRLQTFCSQHKYPTLLFSIGVSCSILSPIIHGVGSVLLLSIGIPSLLSSINSMQSSESNQSRKLQDSAKEEVFLTVKEIQEIITMLTAEERSIKMQLLNKSILSRFSSPTNSNNRVLNSYQSAPVLFSLNNIEEGEEEIETHKPSPRESLRKS